MKLSWGPYQRPPNIRPATRCEPEITMHAGKLDRVCGEPDKDLSENKEIVFVLFLAHMTLSLLIAILNAI